MSLSWMIPLKKGWSEETITDDKTEDSKGVFARAWFDRKQIKYYQRTFLLFINYIINLFTKKHERGHSHGIKDCLSNSIYCIMHEDNDTWAGKIKIIPAQAIGCGTFCAACLKHIEDSIQEDANS